MATLIARKYACSSALSDPPLVVFFQLSRGGGKLTVGNAPQQRLEESRMLIDDLGLQASTDGSRDSGVFSGEEELFAFDRTVSRLTEMQTKDYWKKWRTYVENR